MGLSLSCLVFCTSLSIVNELEQRFNFYLFLSIFTRGQFVCVIVGSVVLTLLNNV